MDAKVMILIVYIIVLIVCTVIAFSIDMPKAGAVCLVCILMCVIMIACCKAQNVEFSEYYLPCEIVATNETSTYFGTVDHDKTQIYAVYTGDNEWPDDVPYLLHMNDMGTEDVTDDEVLMVWRAG